MKPSSLTGMTSVIYVISPSLSDWERKERCWLEITMMLKCSFYRYTHANGRVGLQQSVGHLLSL